MQGGWLDEMYEAAYMDEMVEATREQKKRGKRLAQVMERSSIPVNHPNPGGYGGFRGHTRIETDRAVQRLGSEMMARDQARRSANRQRAQHNRVQNIALNQSDLTRQISRNPVRRTDEQVGNDVRHQMDAEKAARPPAPKPTPTPAPTRAETIHRADNIKVPAPPSAPAPHAPSAPAPHAPSAPKSRFSLGRRGKIGVGLAGLAGASALAYAATRRKQEGFDLADIYEAAYQEELSH